jgi:ABC-type antimicrobial peptide transport system permease subunit
VIGREFTARDDQQTLQGPHRWPTAVIINETFMRRYFGGRNPIGRHLGFGTDPGTPTEMEIVGVVKDIKYTNLRDEVQEQAFIPYLGSSSVRGMTVYLRTAASSDRLMADVRAKVRELDASLPIYGVRTAQAQIDRSLTNERMIASLATVFGLLATMLAVIGLYGVMSYTVAARTREIGIRMALGAAAARVVASVMREVGGLLVIGIAAGLAVSLALTRVLQSQLYGLAAHDLSTIAVAVAALALVTGAAGYFPARRASRVDPMVTLRQG